MPTGSIAWKGLGVPLWGESEITGITSSIDLLTLTTASTAETGSAASFVIQTSAKTPAVNGFRFFPYGRTRIIRTDDQAYGGGYKDVLNVKYDLDYAAGAVQVYAATFILDTADGGVFGGRAAVIALQSYGYADYSTGAAYSWIYLTDQGTTELASFLNVGGSTIGANGMMTDLGDPSASHGLVMYWENTRYWIMVASAST
jgi:hypothetical protein